MTRAEFNTADNPKLDRLAVTSDRLYAIQAKLKTLPTVNVTMFDEIERQPVKSWLVHSLLGADEFSCVFGKPGSGKSVLVGDLACHIAACRPWFGRRVRGGGVLYVAAERAQLVKRRFAAFRQWHGHEGLPLAVVSGGIDLRSNGACVEALLLHAMLLPVPPVLIVVDTLSRVLAGGDENSPKDMGALRDNLLILQERTGAHVLVVHHIPADGTQRLRGHGVMLGSFDTTISVEKRGETRVAAVDKVNDGPDEQAITFSLQSVDLGTDEFDETTTAPVVISSDLTAAPKPDKAKLPKAAQTALRALVEALDERGAIPPASSHIPPGILTVAVAVWRQQSYQRGISTSDEERARQQAFKRAFEHLVGSARVGHWGDQVWLTS